jgi:hypothetical protein
MGRRLSFRAHCRAARAIPNFYRYSMSRSRDMNSLRTKKRERLPMRSDRKRLHRLRDAYDR